MSAHTLSFFNPPDRERLLIREAEAHDRRTRANRSQATPAIAANAARIAEAYPTLDREVIAATSLAGIPADHPLLEQVALRSWEADQGLWDLVTSAIKGTTRVAGTIAQSFYEELVSRPVRTAVGTLQGRSIGEAYSEAGRSVGVRALDELFGGRRVNLGSGFLPSSDVATPDDPNVQQLVNLGADPEVAMTSVQNRYGAPIWQQYIADSERIKFRGMPVSPGRLAAGVFALEPGSLPYNIFSGSIDAISQVLLDPTSKLLVGFKIPKFIGGSGKRHAGLSQVRKDMKLLAGLSPEGQIRNTAFAPALNSWIDGREGQLLLDALFKHREDPIAMAYIFSRSGKAEPPSKVINALGQEGLSRSDMSTILRGETQLIEARTLPGIIAEGKAANLDLLGQNKITGVGLEDVIPALGRTPVATSLAGKGGLLGKGAPGAGVGQSLGGKLGGAIGGALEVPTGGRTSAELGRVLGFKATVGHSIEGTRLGRLFATMPGSQIDFKNLDEGARTLDDWMQEAKFSYDERADILTKWHGLNDADHVAPDFYELVFRDVEEVFRRNIVRDVVPPSVFAQGDEAVKQWRAGTKRSGPRNAKDAQVVKMIENGITKWFDDLDELRRYATIDGANQPFVGSRFTTLANGDMIEQPTAMLLSEYLNRGFSLPQAREVRRAVSKISWAVSNDALDLKLLPGVFDVYMQKIWKPLVLLRVAFPLRVQADNQLRMAAAGLDSVFHHPLDWLSWSIADPTMEGAVQSALKGISRVIPERGDGALLRARRARGETGIIAREVTDNLGIPTEVFDSIMAARKAQAAMTHGGSSLLGYTPGIRNAGDVVYTVLAKGAAGQNAPNGFMQAWVTEFLQLSSDEIAPRVARSKDDAIEWFLHSNQGRKARNALADTKQKQVLVDNAAAKAEGYASADDAAATYIEGVWARIHEKAGGKVTAERLESGRSVYSIAPGGDGNMELINAIASGKMKVGDEILDLPTVGGNRFTRLTDEFNATYYDEWAPDVVKIHDQAKSPLGKIPSSADTMVARLFEALASKPENVLSRSPAFRQFYWQRVEELMPFMDDASRNQIIRGAKAANLDGETLARMAKKNIDSTAARTVDIEAVENIAMAYSLDKTKELLYDLHKRSNFMDIARNVFPFGEAWVEILTRWSKLAYDNPETLRRFQQVVEGGRRSGFVTVDQVTGKEVFNYPGGGLLANWMMAGAGPAGPIAGGAGGAAAGFAVGGIPGAVIGGIGGGAAGALASGQIAGDKGGATLAIQGQVQGLNLATASYLPGLGPIVQVPLSMLFGSGWVESKPNQFGWIKDQIFPFGDPTINSIDDVARLGIPAWGKKILQPLSTGDPDFARLHAHSTMDVIRALLQTPGYSKETPEEWLKLKNDAGKIAGNLSIIRGFLQFGLPTGPQVRYYAAAKTEDPETNGVFYAFQTLASEYRKMLEDNNFDDVAAFDEFKQRFGLDPVDFITSKTTAEVRRGATKPSLTFELTNQASFDRFPLTAYYAAPDDPLDEFDLRGWSRQLDEGTRQPYTPEQWVSARNHTLGSMAYEEAKRGVQGVRAQRGEDNLEAYTKAESAYLRDMKMWLRNKYPGFDFPNVGTPTKGSIEQQINELVGWTNDPVLGQTSAGQGLQLYLEARQTVMNRSVAHGDSATAFQRGKLDGRGQAYRRYLRETAEWIIAQPQYRDFGPLWQSVLSREFKDDIDSELSA